MSADLVMVVESETLNDIFLIVALLSSILKNPEKFGETIET